MLEVLGVRHGCEELMVLRMFGQEMCNPGGSDRRHKGPNCGLHMSITAGSRTNRSNL